VDPVLSQILIVLHGKNGYSCHLFKNRILSTDFRKISSNIKFHEDLTKRESSFSVGVEGRTEVTELIVAFRNFAKTTLLDQPKTESQFR